MRPRKRLLHLGTLLGVALLLWAPPLLAQETGAVREQLLYERSAELWLQGQRYLDLYRTDDPFVHSLNDSCIPIGQTEWETNTNLGG